MGITGGISRGLAFAVFAVTFVISSLAKATDMPSSGYFEYRAEHNQKLAALEENLAQIDADSRSEDSKQQISVIFVDDSSNWDERVMAQFIHRIEKSDQTAVIVRKMSRIEDLEPSISSIMPSAEIRSIYILLHGSVGDVVINLDDVGLNDLAKALSPLSKHMSANGRIVFTSCKVIPEDLVEASKMMRSFADIFGLKSGALYMNYTSGLTFVDAFFTTPAYNMSDFSAGKRSAYAFVQGVAPISLPIWMAVDYAHNWGYSLIRANGKPDVLSSANRFQIDKRKYRSGTPLLTLQRD